MFGAKQSRILFALGVTILFMMPLAPFFPAVVVVASLLVPVLVVVRGRLELVLVLVLWFVGHLPMGLFFFISMYMHSCRIVVVS